MHGLSGGEAVGGAAPGFCLTFQRYCTTPRSRRHGFGAVGPLTSTAPMQNRTLRARAHFNCAARTSGSLPFAINLGWRSRLSHCTLIARWMRLMVRHAVFGFVLFVALAGCASRSANEVASPPHTQLFVTEEQRLVACLDLRDHIVDLYATEYVSREGISMSREERSAFRDGWAEELAKRG